MTGLDSVVSVHTNNNVVFSLVKCMICFCKLSAPCFKVNKLFCKKIIHLGFLYFLFQFLLPPKARADKL